MSVLSLGVLLPLGAGALNPRLISYVTAAAAQTPTKHVTLIDGRFSTRVLTHAATVADFLRERGITPSSADSLSVAPSNPLIDGRSIAYRPAVPVNLAVDGTTRTVMSSAPTVGALLAAEGILLGSHDVVTPARGRPVEPNATVSIRRVTSWLEHVRVALRPPSRQTFDITLPPGRKRLVDAGTPGVKETTIEVLQATPGTRPRRLVLSARILRFPRAKVIAQGVGDYSALAGLARRGVVGTMRLADQALRMVATAYSAACAGCSGLTASGRPAGLGVVAVDPRFIPLGTHLFIPGYGHAFAGDTGGAIHGNRIDLGFNSERDAMTFGRRPVVVYVLK